MIRDDRMVTASLFKTAPGFISSVISSNFHWHFSLRSAWRKSEMMKRKSLLVKSQEEVEIPLFLSGVKYRRWVVAQPKDRKFHSISSGQGNVANNNLNLVNNLYSLFCFLQLRHLIFSYIYTVEIKCCAHLICSWFKKPTSYTKFFCFITYYVKMTFDSFKIFALLKQNKTKNSSWRVVSRLYCIIKSILNILK